MYPYDKCFFIMLELCHRVKSAERARQIDVNNNKEWKEESRIEWNEKRRGGYYAQQHH